MAQNPLTHHDATSAVDAQIDFVLNHPGMSEWIKDALRGALDRPPVEVLNDLEILNRVLRPRSEILISEGRHSPAISAPEGVGTGLGRSCGN